MQDLTSSRQSKYVYIDILRAAAACLVVVYHVIANSQWSQFPITGPALVFRIGWIGVDLFFVISGFVITLSALHTYQKRGSSFRIGFMKRRWLRIAPLYFATIAIYLWTVTPDVLFGSYTSAAIHLFSHFFFLHNLHADTYGSINGANWSVALEMQFYIFIALITPWLAKQNPFRVLFGFILIAWLYRYWTTLFFVPGEATPHEQHVSVSQLPGTLDAFGVGIAVAMLIIKAKETALLGLLKPSWSTFAIWVFTFSVLITISMKLYWPWANYWDNQWMIIFWRTSLAVAFGALIICAVVLPKSKISLLLKPLAYLGEISYGLYLWHLLVLTTLLGYPWLRGSPLLVATLFGTICMSILSWHFFEKKYLKP